MFSFYLAKETVANIPVRYSEWLRQCLSEKTTDFYNKVQLFNIQNTVCSRIMLASLATEIKYFKTLYIYVFIKYQELVFGLITRFTSVKLKIDQMFC